MSTVSIQMPESIRRHVELLAARDGVTMDQFIATAAAEKIAAIEAGEYLAQRASRADREAFLKVLRKVPVGVTEVWDQALPEK